MQLMQLEIYKIENIIKIHRETKEKKDSDLAFINKNMYQVKIAMEKYCLK